MEKSLTSFINKEAIISKDISPEKMLQLIRFYTRAGVSETIPESYKDFYSDLIRGLLKVDHVKRGRVSCLLCVKAVVTVN